MATALFVEIACERCGAWFPPPDFIGKDPSFDPAWLIGITVDCPVCRLLIDCSGDNIRMQGKHGVYLETTKELAFASTHPCSLSTD